MNGFMFNWVFEEGTPWYLLMDPAMELHDPKNYKELKRFNIEPYAVPTEGQHANPAERMIKTFKEFVFRFR